MKIGTCRSCGESIVWTVTRKGKKMPVDAEPISNGTFILEGEGEDTPTAVWIGKTDPYQGNRYESHFSTCPHAAQHRRTP